ncbi:iron-containing alcohol dehydrogenase [Tsukamurella paurometabola]|uniref:Iron-containing alcohol dehydrogenase n=1 Tax=Tsukamurella paurometabola TaxID=2061 RepID=A0ABS5NA13_TSUPA|nr:iron-containing alcohol dehydrogenase [Tsukamurella paurometabola]MBS4101098.1 iron-containing alcohol dehydrogenase [Tsukamurella paurometabola]
MGRAWHLPATERDVARTVKFHAPEIVFGMGALGEAAHAAARLGAVRPMLVTDGGLIEAGWVAELIGHLREAGLMPTVFDELTPNPKDHEVAAGFERYAAADCDVIIALGGGSAMDAAKGIALLTSNGGAILDYAGVDKMHRPIPPTVMVPSTSGTGADVSQFCIVTDTVRESKVTIIGRTLVPDVTVIDPRLLTTMPGWLNAATGLDALTHGIEAFVSIAHNPLTDNHALRSVGMVVRTLGATMTAPRDLSRRLTMAQASLEAGLAFTNAILGVAHAMSHQVGGLLDKPHGVINGILLPHVVRFNAEADPEPYAAIAASMGLPEHRASPYEAAQAVADRIAELAREVGVPRGLADLGVRPEVLPRLARTTLEDACMATNPRRATVDEIVELFRVAL